MDRSDWSRRYAEGNTKWDLGGTPDVLLEFIESRPPGQRILIPGCGRGYEIADLRALGHDVVAVDFSDEAIRAAGESIGNLAEGILCADFFACDLPLSGFDLCYERTFLCSLPLELRMLYGSRVSDLLNDGGLLAGIFHYGAPGDAEPPWPMTEDDRGEILERHFTLVSDAPYPSGLTVFADQDEHWQVWRKRTKDQPSTTDTPNNAP